MQKKNIHELRIDSVLKNMIGDKFVRKFDYCSAKKNIKN